MRREDDYDKKFYFRTHRINCINSRWYFLTREGENIGPFATKEAAKTYVSTFLEKLKPVA